ncbi:hypothetical protein ACJ41O_007208 [Fusarium nematophilum]
MDPLSIAASCAGLIKAIQEISALISRFVANCKDARGDLRAVSLELSDLSFTLDLLQGIVKDDNKVVKRSSIPGSIQGNINSIIENCLSISSDIRQILTEYSSGKLASTCWAIRGKERVETLKTLLEAHRQALNFAVDTITLAIAKDIKNDTGQILEDTTNIKEDATKILEEIARLEALILEKDAPGSQNPTDSRAFMLRRYLEDLTTVASSVCDGFSRPGSPTEFTLPPTISEDPSLIDPADDGKEDEAPHPSPRPGIMRDATSRRMATGPIPLVGTSESQQPKDSIWMTVWRRRFRTVLPTPVGGVVGQSPAACDSSEETFREWLEVRLKEAETKVAELEEIQKASEQMELNQRLHIAQLARRWHDAEGHLKEHPGWKEGEEKVHKAKRDLHYEQLDHRKRSEAFEARRHQLEDARREKKDIGAIKAQVEEAERVAQNAQSLYTPATVAANAAARSSARPNNNSRAQHR